MGRTNEWIYDIKVNELEFCCYGNVLNGKKCILFVLETG